MGEWYSSSCGRREANPSPSKSRNTKHAVYTWNPSFSQETPHKPVVAIMHIKLSINLHIFSKKMIRFTFDRPH
ncbi:hypothetical protein F443_09172, partial [Phytophthora nicotianae P1569]